MPLISLAAAVLRCKRVKGTLGHLIRHKVTAGGMNRRSKPMPLYLSRFNYTPATWAKLMKNPENRRAAAKQYIEAVGGKLHGFWYAFGDHDGYNLWEAPDNISMAATPNDCLANRRGDARSHAKGVVDRVSTPGR
jgi:uncharacterized protein with GYD domain